MMGFGEALEVLKNSGKASRAGWNGKGLHLELQRPDAHSKMTLPYLYLVYPDVPASDTAPNNHIGAKVPWQPSQTDLLANDWLEVS
jgi:hypothetical protein